MDIIQLVVQWIIGLGIFNVWLIRANWSTAYRGGDARNIKEEFAVYGLPTWFMYAVGTLKVVLAALLIAGTWIPGVVQPAAIGMAVLMVGAVSMHIKVKDTVKKILPSLTVLVLSLLVAILSG